MPPAETPFWRRLSLLAMSDAQWESLCDRCGRCCLQRVEVDGRLLDTCLSCRLYDPGAQACGDYDNRHQRVPDCVRLSPRMGAREFGWLPHSCAYRRLAEGRGLPDWHPLVSGDPDSGRQAAGIAGHIVDAPKGIGSGRLEDYVSSLPIPPE